MQEDYDTIYCVVDLHAMTVPYVPADLERERRQLARMILAVGVDPARSLFYYQSDVPQHVELAWVLTTIAGVGQLERMTQYKEKSDKSGQTFGLLAYPVLMAADILIHRAHAVPVGDDQTQHLELTRDLAERFNSRFGELFPLPERITPEIGARVMSLTDPTAKMSKSDPSPRSRILLTDTTDQIVSKVKAAVTDAGSEVAYDWESKPGISNLLEIFSFFSGRPVADLVSEHGQGGYGVFKLAVAEAVAAGIGPIREAYEGMSDDEVAHVMSTSAERGQEMAEKTMTTVRDVVGLS
jgi:tryptophanyl-tRNA synthetase